MGKEKENNEKNDEKNTVEKMEWKSKKVMSIYKAMMSDNKKVER